RSIVVDMHSRHGFSGSPVYIYRPTGGTMVQGINASGSVLGKVSGPISTRRWGAGLPVHVRLLGLLWGQFPERWEIGGASSAVRGSPAIITEGAYLEGMSGLSCVCPAAEIVDVIRKSKRLSEHYAG